MGLPDALSDCEASPVLGSVDVVSSDGPKKLTVLLVGADTETEYGDNVPGVVVQPAAGIQTVDVQISITFDLGQVVEPLLWVVELEFPSGKKLCSQDEKPVALTGY